MRNNRAFICLLAMLSMFLFVSLASGIVRDVVVTPPAYAQPGMPGHVNLSIHVASLIAENGLENATYRLSVENGLNFSVVLDIYVDLGDGLLSVVMEKDGKEVSLKKQGSGNTYRTRVHISANTTDTYLLRFRRYILPNMWDLGLWNLKYSYGNPVRMEVVSPPGSVVPLVSYKGTIVLRQKPEKVECSTCEYDSGTGVVDVSEGDFFWMSWDVKRTPYKAIGIYIVLILALLVYGRRVVSA